MGLSVISPIKIEPVDSTSPHLDAVKSLGKKNAKTLGLFPDGAFDDYADRKTILVATDSANGCVGYLLYRKTRQRISIVHLCISESNRGAGVARRLVEHLIETTRDCRDIALKCRRDFPANSLWPRLGFSVVRESPGRGAKGELLVHWWRGHQDTGLFANSSAALRESKVCAVIDANILFDLREPTSDKTLASKSLQADWLEDVVELCVTDEIFNEINRQPDGSKRQASERFAKGFHCLSTDNDQFDTAYSAIKPLFPTDLNNRQESDLRQIACAIASDAPYFITRDEPLLALRNEIEAAHEIQIVHPAGFVGKIDESQREEAYRPSRFSGTPLPVRRLVDQDLDAAYDCLHLPREKKHELRDRLRRWMSNPQTYCCTAVFGHAQEPQALVVTSVEPDELLVHLLRIKRGPLATTLALQMVRQCLLLAVSADQAVTRFAAIDQPEIEPALSFFSFTQDPGGWVRVGPIVIETTADMAARLRRLGQDHHGLDTGRMAEDAATFESAGPDNSKFESRLWPAKISDCALANYIVPIQPRWAQELFDDGLSAENLYGRKQELGLNVEGVYYRAARPGGIQSPARILWYVSHEDNTGGSKSIRASSRLCNVKVATAKELFKEYRRLGIYEWKDVFATAHNDLSKKIMAMHFADTELFAKPISLQKLRDVATQMKCSLQLQSPCRIPSEVFLKLYAEAVR